MALTSNGKRYCDVKVHGGRMGMYPCSLPVKHKYQGKDYCSTHHPPSIAAREKNAIRCAGYDRDNGGHQNCTTQVRKEGDRCRFCADMTRFYSTLIQIKKLELANKRLRARVEYLESILPQLR